MNLNTNKKKINIVQMNVIKSTQNICKKEKHKNYKKCKN